MAKSKLELISARAKTIYGAKGNKKKWTDCIKAATKELKAEKKI